MMAPLCSFNSHSICLLAPCVRRVFLAAATAPFVWLLPLLLPCSPDTRTRLHALMRRIRTDMRMAAITVLMAMASAAVAVVAGVTVAGQSFRSAHTNDTRHNEQRGCTHCTDALHLHQPSHPSAALHRCERVSGVPPPIHCSPCSLFRFRAIPRVLLVAFLSLLLCLVPFLCKQIRQVSATGLPLCPPRRSPRASSSLPHCPSRAMPVRLRRCSSSRDCCTTLKAWCPPTTAISARTMEAHGHARAARTRSPRNLRVSSRRVSRPVLARHQMEICTSWAV